MPSGAAVAAEPEVDIDLFKLRNREGQAVQADFYRAGNPYAAYVGGRGIGKSLTLILDAIDYAETYPGSTQVFTEPQFSMIEDVVLPHLNRYWGRRRGDGINWNESSPINIVVSGSRDSEIWLRSAQSVAEDVRRGPNLARGLMDEASVGNQELAFKVIDGSVRDMRFPNRQMKVTGTPQGRNWLWRVFRSEQRVSNVSFVTATSMDAEDCGFLPEGWCEQRAALYGGWDSPFARQELGGQFLEMAGQVFGQFSRSVHVRSLPVEAVVR